MRGIQWNKIHKDKIEQKNHNVQVSMNKKLIASNQPEFWQRIKMKDDHSRNLYHHQINHLRFNKIYSSGEREDEEVPGNYLAKTTEKLKFSKKKDSEIKTSEKTKFSNLNQNNLKILFKNSNKSRGRSNKSGPFSNRNSSSEAPNNGVGAISKGVKIKNPQQTIKFFKKKIHIKRTISQNPKRPRSLSNNMKVLSSKKSDESGNNREEGEDNFSNWNKKGKTEQPTGWHNNGANIEKVSGFSKAVLASISKISNTANFTSEDFTAGHMMKKNPNLQQTHTVSPDNKNDQVKNQQNFNPNQKILSMTMKANENLMVKNSGTIEASSYNSLLSHQNKSFSNTKNERSMNAIVNNKAIVPKKK
jgi:hypothetical protein